MSQKPAVKKNKLATANSRMNLHCTSLGRHLQQTGEAKRSLIQQNTFCPLKLFPNTSFLCHRKKKKQRKSPPSMFQENGVLSALCTHSPLLSAVAQTGSHSSHGLSKINFPTWTKHPGIPYHTLQRNESRKQPTPAQGLVRMLQQNLRLEYQMSDVF